MFEITMALLTITNFLIAMNSMATDQYSHPPRNAYAPYVGPSFLYIINNLPYLWGLQLTTPALLLIAILANVYALLPCLTFIILSHLLQLPFTAVLHRLVIKHQRNIYAWIWLSILCQVSLLQIYFRALVIASGLAQIATKNRFPEPQSPFDINILYSWRINSHKIPGKASNWGFGDV
jgi:hypothetical protein